MCFIHACSIWQGKVQNSWENNIFQGENIQNCLRIVWFYTMWCVNEGKLKLKFGKKPNVEWFLLEINENKVKTRILSNLSAI